MELLKRELFLSELKAVEVPDDAGGEATGLEKLLRDLCDTLTYGSLCALGGLTPYPVLSAINHFPEDFVTSARTRVPA